MSDRYFSTEPILAEQHLLEGPEAHHLARVMRVAVGSEIILFDGRGSEYVARVEAVKKDRVQLQILERREIDRECAVELTLAVSLPKGDRQRWLIEKCVELGVARLIPLMTTRSVAQPLESALERLRRAVIEASKQCGRNRLMEIAEPLAWCDLATQPAVDALRLFAHPESSQSSAPIDLPPRVLIAVGPEGGFTDDELHLAREHAWRSIALGTRILRIETAAIAVAATVLTPLRFHYPD